MLKAHEKFYRHIPAMMAASLEEEEELPDTLPADASLVGSAGGAAEGLPSPLLVVLAAVLVVGSASVDLHAPICTALMPADGFFCGWEMCSMDSSVRLCGSAAQVGARRICLWAEGYCMNSTVMVCGSVAQARRNESVCGRRDINEFISVHECVV